MGKKSLGIKYLHSSSLELTFVHIVLMKIFHKVPSVHNLTMIIGLAQILMAVSAAVIVSCQGQLSGSRAAVEYLGDMLLLKSGCPEPACTGAGAERSNCQRNK